MLMDRFQNKLEFSGYDIPKQEDKGEENTLWNLYCK